jgi:hypothetical protein
LRADITNDLGREKKKRQHFLQSQAMIDQQGKLKYVDVVKLCLKDLLPKMEECVLKNWRKDASNHTRSGFVNWLMHCFSNYNAAWDPEGLFRGHDWSVYKNPNGSGNDDGKEARAADATPTGNDSIVAVPEKI